MSEPALMTKDYPDVAKVSAQDAAVVALSDSVRKVVEAIFALELRGQGGITEDIVQAGRALSKMIDKVAGREA